MRNLMIAFTVAILVLSACGKEEDYGTGIRPEGPSYVPKDCVFQTVGLKNPSSGENDEDRYPSFAYTGYEPLKEQPVKVLYYIPDGGDVKTMPVLFAFTGAERTGNTQLNAWKLLADHYQFVVINPQFEKKYWKENQYQFGGVTDSAGSFADRSLWTFNIVESLFDYWLHEVDGTQEGYRMFGHSAGAQFVGRMVMAMPESRVIRAVAANPSSWAWPVELKDADGKSYGWPYSISGLPGADKDGYLADVFSKKLYVQIGQNDTDTESLDMSAAAKLQGERRYHRAKNFYQACVDKAEADKVDCAFRLAEVEGVGHSTWHMVYGYYKPTATNVKEEQLGQNSAYLLLFK